MNTFKSQINIASKKRIEFITTRVWCQIISFRKSVLCNQVQWLLHLDFAEQKQNLLNYIKSQFARFCTLYIDVCSRKLFAHCFFIDFSIIFHLSHFVDTSCEFSTVKLHKYWINEIAMWDEKSKISIKHRWRCRMNHRTSRQCVAISLSHSRQLSDERYLYHDVFSSQF